MMQKETLMPISALAWDMKLRSISKIIAIFLSFIGFLNPAVSEPVQQKNLTSDSVLEQIRKVYAHIIYPDFP